MTTTDQSNRRTIQRRVRDDGVCVLTFDRPGSAANILDQGTLVELGEELDFIERESQLKGLVLISAKPSIFIAGADLNAFRAGAPLEEVRHLIEYGQEIMNRIAGLPIPTVAAIHGAALGGGYEICLACDYRVASSDRKTRIGLPETQLGLLPAWGGTTRLPRLIGLRKALELIVGGKPVTAQKAAELGLVDELATREDLLDAAVRELGLGKSRRARHWLLNNRLAAALGAALTRRKFLKRTGVHYPAPLKALQVAARGFSRPLNAALSLERTAFLELVQTDAAHNLIELFFLEERAKRGALPGSLPQAEPKPITRAAVIGAGVMGAGIAQWLSARQIKVALWDVNAGQAAKGMDRVASVYRDSVKRGIMTQQEMDDGLSRVHLATDETPLRDSDLVVEAAFEEMAVKKDIFRRLDELVPAQAILTTNTSALSISELAAMTRHPERVVGLHFFNPVHRMQLIEVIAARQTAPEVLQRAVRFAQRIGKLPVTVKDSPGFVANRLLTPYFNEAQSLFESGVAVTALDEVMLDFGLPMGPMRLLDEIGLDVELRIAETLVARFGDRMTIPACLRKAVEAGWLGRKNGRGFYLHDEAVGRKPNDEIATLVRSRGGRSLSLEELQERMIFAMVNEAARCLEEGIVAGPEDIDFVMVKGTGFPPFRGGVLRYADSLGAARLLGAMEQLVDSGATQFTPCALLRSMAVRGESFYGRERGKHEQRESKAA